MLILMRLNLQHFSYRNKQKTDRLNYEELVRVAMREGTKEFTIYRFTIYN